MASVDTNMLLRWALGDLTEQTDAATRLREDDDEVHVADAAIIEMGFVLEKIYKLNRDLVSGYIRAVMSLGQVNCNRSVFTKAIPLYEQYPQLSLTGCRLAVYASLNDATPIHTFDEQLAGRLPEVACSLR